MLDLKVAADVYEPTSLANRMRARRFALFEALVEQMPKPVRIIDIGGTDAFWEHRGWAGRNDVAVTTVNREPTPVRHANLQTVQGDATDLHRYEELVDEVRLLTIAEMKLLFSEANLWHERFWGLSKSIVAFAGFGTTLEELSVDRGPRKPSRQGAAL